MGFYNPVNPYQSAPQFSFNTPIQPVNNGINWVQGIEGAKAYQLHPNSNAVLMDSENEGIFYIKISDNVGMCNLRAFRYEEITQTKTSQVNAPDLTEYVKKEDLKAEVENLVNSIIGGQMNEQPIPATKSGKTITK